MKRKINKRDFISLSDFNQKEIWNCLKLAQNLKKKKFSKVLQGRSIGLIFQKPSTRTSVSFAVGVFQLGGQPLILNADILQIKRGESPRDTGRVLSRYLDGLVVRASRHEDLLEMAKYASVPVINGLTDAEHPCQVIADLMTIIEKKKIREPKQLKSLQVTYLGDGNNIAQSWILAAAQLGIRLYLAFPKGYGPKKEFLKQAEKLSSKGHRNIRLLSNPKMAIANADVVYTDVWASMGQESETRKRKKVFAPYQLNRKLLRLAKSKALVMHCLPAHRGEEITDDVIEGRQSVVFDQAENRLHVQKAILASLISKGKLS